MLFLCPNFIIKLNLKLILKNSIMKKMAFALFFSIPVLAFSQGFMQTHVAKVGITPLMFRSIALNYEFAFNEEKSISIHGGFTMPHSLPSGLDLEDNEFNGFFIMPEYRMYKSFKHAPGGFYLAPYARFNRYNTSVRMIDFYQENDGDLEASLTNFGVALQLGYQFFLSDRITLDVYFFGAGLFYNMTKTKITPDDPNLTEEFKQEIDNASVDIPLLGKKMEIDNKGDHVLITAPFLSPGIRIGASLGIAFYKYQ
jgi:hypothetical protein